MTETLLLIGGIDSGAGAGLLRDHATALSLGLSVRVVVTALTAQNDCGVRSVNFTNPTMIAAQIVAAVEAGPIAAVKIGMLGNAGIVRAVEAALPNCPIVLDPVLSSTSGHSLLDPSGLLCLRRMIPKVSVLTPNLPELALLSGQPQPQSAELAESLARAWPIAVLVKDGHGAGHTSTDYLFQPNCPALTLPAPRQRQSRRGTGCTLATALACGLAQGLSLEAAARKAKLAVGTYLSSIVPAVDCHDKSVDSSA
ncbi:bifunctional hydroxymethylpyrimidine kinase/phosphomethylpyrimidine kinase [Neogemmobacter tilapiae]|uniref:hydroxymethylpyrimidine kinase n=1 Tax=Neogemmobacter tilapiae TaxID=875041 RepID=A0A918TJQ0_9RHOB|nr:hydroxymethylpyrimidine/phosphomethylpyrimidine kinase [Gemmobacter tilapiae]GHC51301.1 hydroxymethylpyrimidine/phosphomethylpyrimidine kinase [Gemmobacter tilapiae]